MARATSQYPWAGEDPTIVLVLSHKKRLLLNRFYNVLRDGDGVRIPCVACDAEIERMASRPQEMFLKPGMRLLGSGSSKKVLNGIDYIVKGWTRTGSSSSRPLSTARVRPETSF